MNTMELLKYVALAVAVSCASCSYFEYDNYELPDAGLCGQVIDKKTGAPLQAESGNSFKVEYYELSWENAGHENTQPRFFWGKQDGTFRNTKIFAGDYRISLKEGAFHSIEPVEVTLKSGKVTELPVMEVVPFARVKIADVEITGSKNNKIRIKYEVEDTETEIDTEGMDASLYKLREAKVFLSSKSPNVGEKNTETVYTVQAKKDISDYTPGTPRSYTETKVRELPSGKWWIRVGVRTDNPQKRYNFSEVYEVTIP